MTTEKLEKMKACCVFLEDPAPEVVRELINELQESQNAYKLLQAELQGFPNLTAMRECMIEAADYNVFLEKALKQAIDIINKHQNLSDIPKYHSELCKFINKN